MKWGFNENGGVQLSYTHDAIHIEQEPTGWILELLELLGWADTEAMCNNGLKEANISPKYDFYLTSDTDNEKLTRRDRSGQIFCSEIIEAQSVT